MNIIMKNYKKIVNWQNEVRDIEYEIFKIVNKSEIKKPSNDAHIFHKK